MMHEDDSQQRRQKRAKQITVRLISELQDKDDLDDLNALTTAIALVMSKVLAEVLIEVPQPLNPVGLTNAVQKMLDRLIDAVAIQMREMITPALKQAEKSKKKGK